jgi:hypothetical protein
VDETALTVTAPTGATTEVFQVQDEFAAPTLSVQNSISPTTDPDVFVRGLIIDNNGLGAGTGAIFNTSGIVTANRTFIFPDNNGQFLIRVGTVTVAPRATTTSGTLVTTGNNPSGQAWLINGYATTTTPGTGNVQVQILFTDQVGAKTIVPATLTMIAGASAQFSICIKTANASAITYATVVVTTGSYALHLRASGL